jgi:hypothetical protein
VRQILLGLDTRTDERGGSPVKQAEQQLPVTL